MHIMYHVWYLHCKVDFLGVLRGVSEQTAFFWRGRDKKNDLEIADFALLCSDRGGHCIIVIFIMVPL